MPETKSFIEPVWENVTAPCGGVGGCPAHTNIAGSLHALSLDDVNQAWKIMMETHPLRSVLGRVCYGFCEEPCNRGDFDSPVSIQVLEAVIGDYGFDPDYEPEKAEPNGKKILIVGSGPCGLTAGWYLTLAGFETIIYEASERPGGMLRYGIPSYRLEKDILDREIGLIEKIGVKIELNKKVNTSDIVRSLDGGEFDAVIVASGAGNIRYAGFEGEKKGINGLDFLRRINTGEYKEGHLTGKKVIVIGGGNAAMDASRSAVRLGAESVRTVYRRTEEMMPAHANEVQQAKEEGVIFEFLSSPEIFDGANLTSRKMKLGEPDDTGRRRPEPSDETVEYSTDVLIMAIGQEPGEWDFGKRSNVFIGGDARKDSEGTVIHSIASGKRSADEVSRLLTGIQLFEPPGDEVTYDKMNVDRYFTRKMRLKTFKTPSAKRRLSFEPVESAVSLEEGVVEADRCFRCGTCIGGLNSICDWCFRACGEKDGIVKVMAGWNPQGPFYNKKEGCDVCGRCWEDCPRYVVRPAVVGEEK